MQSPGPTASTKADSIVIDIGAASASSSNFTTNATSSVLYEANRKATTTSTTTTSAQHGHDRQPSVQLKIRAAGGPPGFQTKSVHAECVRNVLGQLVKFVLHLSPLVQAITFIQVLLYLVQLCSPLAGTLELCSLTPGEIIAPSRWYHTVLALWAHCLLETNWAALVIDLLVLSSSATLIEPLWGYKEVLRFLAVSCIPAAILTCIHYVLLYTITFNAQYLFEVHIFGLAHYWGALSVTVKQLLPESVLLTTSFGRLKSDHIPFTVFVGVLVGHLIGLFTGMQCLMFSYGLLTSWLYLRFYQPHTHHTISTVGGGGATTITRGDRSDAFAFETFFPNVLRPVVAVFSAAVYNVFVRCGVCPPVPSAAARLLNESGGGGGIVGVRTTNPTMSSSSHHHYMPLHNNHNNNQYYFAANLDSGGSGGGGGPLGSS